MLDSLVEKDCGRSVLDCVEPGLGGREGGSRTGELERGIRTRELGRGVEDELGSERPLRCLTRSGW